MQSPTKFFARSKFVKKIHAAYKRAQCSVFPQPLSHLTSQLTSQVNDRSTIMPGPKSKPATAPEAKSKGKSKAEVGVEVPTASKGKKRSKGLDADEGEGEGEDGGRTAGDAEVKKKAKKAKVGKDESEVGGKKVLKGKKKEAVEEVEEEAQVTEEPASKSASKTKATSEVTTKPPSSKSRPTSKSSKKTVEEAQEDVDEEDEPFGADEALAGFEAEDEDDIGSSDEEEGEGPEKGVRFDLESLPKPKKASEAPKGKGKKAAGGVSALPFFLYRMAIPRMSWLSHTSESMRLARCE